MPSITAKDTIGTSVSLERSSRPPCWCMQVGASDTRRAALPRRGVTLIPQSSFPQGRRCPPAWRQLAR
jgi:hypothetical protein